MGVCCSKNDVVALKNTKGKKTDQTLLLTENVGEVSKLNNGEALDSLNLPNVPQILEPEGLSNTEAGDVNSSSKDDPSAARSTLIFPSYTGYRNQDRFGVNKKVLGVDYAPTALVAPVQALSGEAVDFNSQRNSPLPSRYSPMLRKDKYFRSRPGINDSSQTPTRKGSVESGGFDSDLESSIEDIPVDDILMPNNSPDSKTDVEHLTILDHISTNNKNDFNHRNDVGIGTDLVATKQTNNQPQSATSTGSFGTNTEKDQKSTNTFGMQTSNPVVKMVDASIGTDSDKFYRSSKTRTVQVDMKKKKTMTSSASTGTEPASPGKKSTSDIMVGTELASNAESKRQKPVKKTDKKKTYVKMVDASVGTDSDKFYRSKKSVKVEVDLKKKENKTSSVSAGTDTTGFNPLKVKSTHEMSVGTDLIPVGESPIEKNDISIGTDEQKSYVKMVDAGVGTISDEFYRSTVSKKVQINKKKKKMATLSTGTGTNTDSSPKLLRKPKIVTEIEVTPPQKKRTRKASPSPVPSIDSPEKKEEPHPIMETLENAFMRFAKYGDINGDGLEMNNKNWAKLCRDCEFINNRHVLVGEVDVIFSRHKQKGYRLINFEMFLNCLNEIADKTYSNRIKNEWARRELIYQRVIGKAPELVGITSISKTGNVDRMTDHHLYPVSHKIRFDEDGKGTGIEEKFELHDSQLGYVQGYKDRDTYNLKMMGFTRERSGMNMTSSRLPSPRSPSRPHSSQSIRT